MRTRYATQNAWPLSPLRTMFVVALTLATLVASNCSGPASLPTTASPAPSQAPAPTPAPTPAPGPTIATITVAGKDIDFHTTALNPGQSAPATAMATFADGSTMDVTDQATWTSSNELAATVSAGMIQGLAAGDTRIRATFGRVSGGMDIAVREPVPKPTPTPTPAPKPTVTTTLYGFIGINKPGCIFNKQVVPANCIPVPGTTIEVTSPEACAGQWTRTGPDSRYRLEVKCASNFRVRFALPDGRDQNYTAGGGGELKYDIIFSPSP